MDPNTGYFAAVAYAPGTKQITRIRDFDSARDAALFAGAAGWDAVIDRSANTIWTYGNPAPEGAGMKASTLAAVLDAIKAEHGDVYVSVRHESAHGFGPDDDLTDIAVRYDDRSNLAVISVYN